MGLEPIIPANLPAAGDTIIEKLERYLGEHGNVGFACILLTPDDEGHKAGKVEDRKHRARQNVVLELGMVLARIGRRRVTILHKESVELPSDQRLEPVEAVIQLAGEDHVALGSDLDGGPTFPLGMRDVRDFPKLTEAMQRGGARRGSGSFWGRTRCGYFGR